MLESILESEKYNHCNIILLKNHIQISKEQNKCFRNYLGKLMSQEPFHHKLSLITDLITLKISL